MSKRCLGGTTATFLSSVRLMPSFYFSCQCDDVFSTNSLLREHVETMIPLPNPAFWIYFSALLRKSKLVANNEARGYLFVFSKKDRSLGTCRLTKQIKV